MSDVLLRGSQKSFLRGLAQKMDASVKVGKAGVTESLLKEINQILEANELVKLRFTSADRSERDGWVKEIEAQAPCFVVGQVGHTAVFYRQNPSEEKRRITLP